METLLDYVKWMGRYGFDACPLRDADVLVLCVISYFDLSPLMYDASEDEAAPRGPVYVRDARRLIEEDRAKLLITGGDLGNRELFETAVRSERFGNLQITDCVDILRDEPPLQFAAMTFRSEGHFSLIAYRGTDSSLSGWKENFMISFTRTEAQELAADYAHRMIGKSQEQQEPWYISGHSKGGNLALYASCMLTDDELSRVERSYILDGPGLCPEVLDISLIERINGKTTRIIPEFDVVGKLFEPEITDTRIIHSFRDGIEQHSLPSWLVEHGELAVTDRNANLSLRLNEIIDAWVEDRPMEDRAIFIDELFDALGADGVTDLQDMTFESLGSAIVSLRAASESTKETLADLRRRAFFGGLEVPAWMQRGSEAEQEAAPLETDTTEAEGRAGKLSGESFGKLRSWWKHAAAVVSSSPELTQGVTLIPAGILVCLASESFLDIICLLLTLGIAGLQFYLTYRRLKASGWSVRGQRESIYLSIILAALVVALFLKDQAMFLFGSLITGVLLLIAAYQTGERAAGAAVTKTERGLLIAESAAATVFGLSFLVIPRESVKGYAWAIGIGMILDGAVRLIRGLNRRRTGMDDGRDVR